jgi:phosphonate transport system permease protein
MTSDSKVSSAAFDSGVGSRWLLTPARAAGIVIAFAVLAVCWHVDGVQLGSALHSASVHALLALLRGLFPPDFSRDFLRIVFRALVSTLATAIAGTALSLVVAIPLGMLATPILWRRGILSAANEKNSVAVLQSAASQAVFALLGLLRAVPDLAWGLLFVTAVGLGSLAGVLALAVAYAGVLGRVYADVFANVDTQPLEALQATGASRLQIFLRGVWPQAFPNVVAYTLYSLECCIRAASVLGFVGAGGIGYEVGLSMRLFEYRQVMTLILAFVLLLALTDAMSKWLRWRLRFKGGSARGGTGHYVRYGVVAVAVIASLYLSGFTPEHFREADLFTNMLRFCRGLWPPDFAKEFVLSISPLLMQTLAISVLGTFMGVAIGGILAIPATSTFVFAHPDEPGVWSLPRHGLRWIVFLTARLLLNVLRSIPDLVWVLVCILLVGVGPFAGTLAIGLHTAGVLGKLYAETMEEAPMAPIEGLRSLGAGRVQLLAWALWPQAKRMLGSYTVLRWEANLRVSAILGLVGGGGLGQAIYNNAQLGFYPRLATLLLLVYLLVVVSDRIGEFVVHERQGI